MIRKIQVEPFEVEKILGNIDPNWKNKTLYQWQWDEVERAELNHLKILPLQNFSKETIGDYTVYQKGSDFVIVTSPDQYYKKVLTNIEPKPGSFLYNPKQPPQKLTIDGLL